MLEAFSNKSVRRTSELPKKRDSPVASSKKRDEKNFKNCKEYSFTVLTKHWTTMEMTTTALRGRRSLVNNFLSLPLKKLQPLTLNLWS